ncbi:MAG: molybdopterin molybdotransferase MoeA [Thaumarchaeota archaeon]|nr:molybdopterin molybdotransferase MoeA [Nitrososphaerota archaeon]
MRTYTPMKDALSKLYGNVKVKVDIERVQISDAFRRIAAETVISKFKTPPYNLSHVDGYAVIAEDTKSYKSLEIKGSIRLGDTNRRDLLHGEALEIPTGGYLPKGADAALPVEYSKVVANSLFFEKPLDKGQNVTQAGSDISIGQTILRRGQEVRAQDLDLLAMVRAKDVGVYRKPIVSIISTGSELTEDYTNPPAGKIPSSHNLLVSGMVEDSGGVPLNLGIAADETAILKGKLQEGLRRSDIVVTIGGSSVGKADIVSKVINSLGKPGMVVEGIMLQPGRVSGFGVIDGKPIVLLPGFILSTIISFALFVKPLFELVTNRTPIPFGPPVAAFLTRDAEFKSFPSFRKAVFVKLTRNEHSFLAEPLHGDSSMMSVLQECDGLIITEEKTSVIKAGAGVLVHILPGCSTLSTIGGSPDLL